MPIRIVTWNCADWFPRKAGRLQAVDPDIVFVPEVREEHSGALGDRFASVWEGVTGQKGLLIAARNPWRLEVVHRASLRHMLMAKASLGTEEVLLVGVWAMPGTGGYVGAVTSGVDELPTWPLDAAVVVAGDFNASPVFDAGNPRNQQFENISSRLHFRGLHSLWHTSSDETFGEESAPTYFHQWKREQPFHIDFMFASPQLRRRLKSLQLGAYEDWCQGGSDHMPMIADFD